MADDDQRPHPAVALCRSSPPSLAVTWPVLKPKALFGSEPNNGKASLSYIVHRVASLTREKKEGMHGCLSGWLILSPPKGGYVSSHHRLEMR